MPRCGGARGDALRTARGARPRSSPITPRRGRATRRGGMAPRAAVWVRGARLSRGDAPLPGGYASWSPASGIAADASSPPRACGGLSIRVGLASGCPSRSAHPPLERVQQTYQRIGGVDRGPARCWPHPSRDPVMEGEGEPPSECSRKRASWPRGGDGTCRDRDQRASGLAQLYAGRLTDCLEMTDRWPRDRSRPQAGAASSRRTRTSCCCVMRANALRELGRLASADDCRARAALARELDDPRNSSSRSPRCAHWLERGEPATPHWTSPGKRSGPPERLGEHVRAQPGAQLGRPVQGPLR